MNFPQTIDKLIESNIFNNFEYSFVEDSDICYVNAASHYFGNAKNTIYPLVKINYSTGLVTIEEKQYKLGVNAFIEAVV